MDLKGERASIDNETFEFGHQGIEAANKLQVLYLFKKEIRFTDSFKETIHWIIEDDGHWADFNELYEGSREWDQAGDSPHNDPLAYMVDALVNLHILRLKLVKNDEDFELATIFLYTFYHFHWGRFLEKATIGRDGWLPLWTIESNAKSRAMDDF